MQVTPDTTIGELEIAINKSLSSIFWDANLAEAARLSVESVGVNEESIDNIISDLADSNIGNTELGFNLASCVSAVCTMYSER